MFHSKMLEDCIAIPSISSCRTLDETTGLRFAGPFAPAISVAHKNLVRGLDIDHRVIDRLAAIRGAGEGARNDLEESSRAQHAVIGVRVQARLARGHLHRPISIGAKDLADHIRVRSM